MHQGLLRTGRQALLPIILSTFVSMSAPAQTLAPARVDATTQDTGPLLPSADVEAVESVEMAEVEVLTETDLVQSEAYAAIDRGINVMLARPLPKGALQFVVGHRTQTPALDEPFFNFLGFDGGSLKVGLGLRYGVVDGLDVGFVRSNGTVEIFDTYQFDARLRVLRQEDVGLDAAVSAGGTWFAQPGLEDASGFFGSLLLTRSFGNRIIASAMATAHSDSSNPRKKTTAKNATVGAGGLLEIRIMPMLAWDVEVVVPVAGFAKRYPIMSTGVKVVTNRHTFSVLAANSQALTYDAIITGTHRGALDKWILGFNITRQFDMGGARQ